MKFKFKALKVKTVPMNPGAKKGPVGPANKETAKEVKPAKPGVPEKAPKDDLKKGKKPELKVKASSTSVVFIDEIEGEYHDYTISCGASTPAKAILKAVDAACFEGNEAELEDMGPLRLVSDENHEGTRVIEATFGDRGHQAWVGIGPNAKATLVKITGFDDLSGSHEASHSAKKPVTVFNKKRSPRDPAAVAPLKNKIKKAELAENPKAGVKKTAGLEFIVLDSVSVTGDRDDMKFPTYDDFDDDEPTSIAELVDQGFKKETCTVLNDGSTAYFLTKNDGEVQWFPLRWD